MLERCLVLSKLRSVLAVPRAYELFWRAVGGARSSAIFSREYVRARAGDEVLDIGCGPGTIVPFLPVGCNYTGFDISAEYIAAARERFPQARFVCERVSDYTLPRRGSFDVVLASGIVHHVDDAEAVKLFETARAALKPGGKLTTIDPVFTDDQSAVARHLLQRDRGEFVRDRQGYLCIASAVFPNVNATVRHDLLRIPYTHIILECAG